MRERLHKIQRRPSLESTNTSPDKKVLCAKKFLFLLLQVLTFTPDSSLSPPHQDDSEDESSFMTHTQVDEDANGHHWDGDHGDDDADDDFVDDDVAVDDEQLDDPYEICSLVRLTDC